MRAAFYYTSGAIRSAIRRLQGSWTRIVLWGNGAVVAQDVVINGMPNIRNYGSLNIGRHVTINSGYSTNPVAGSQRTSLVVSKGAVLSIGDNSGMSNCEIRCRAEIIIGRDVLLGGGCCLYDSDAHALTPSARLEEATGSVGTKPIHICDGVFVGTRAIILKGVTLGRGCVIGAGSIVTHDVPAGEVWAGNPARFIRSVS